MKCGRFIQSVIASGSLFALTIIGNVRAQDTINIRLFAPPSGVMHIEAMWRILVINTGSALEDVYLTGEGFDLGMSAERPIAWGTSVRFRLRRGTYFITPADFSPIDGDGIDPYKKVVQGVNRVPSGVYRICTTLRNSAGDSLATACITEHVVLNVSPPRLLQPRDGATDVAPHPTFVWTPAMPQDAADMRYSLKIVEMLGSQSAYDAMNSNPVWYEQDAIDATILRYPFDGLSFDTATTYAWQVTVTTEIDGSDATLAKSEIWTFMSHTHSLAPGGSGHDRVDNDTAVRWFDTADIGKRETGTDRTGRQNGNVKGTTSDARMVQSMSRAATLVALPVTRDTIAAQTEGYALVGSTYDASYVRAVGRLRFAYDNDGAARKLRVSIYDDQHALLKPERQPLDVSRGRNRYEFDLTTQPGLLDGAFYTLVVGDGDFDAQHLRFRYVKPTVHGEGDGKTK